MTNGKMSKPIIISSDNHVLDGHHRWLAAMNGRKHNMHVFKLSVPAKEGLSLLINFPKTKFKDIHESIKEDKENIYDILEPEDCGPFDGGCVLVAQALQKIHGGDIIVLVNDRGIADHAAVKIGNTLLDYDGALPADKFITRFEKNEHVKVTGIRPIEPNDLPDATRNQSLLPKIVDLLSGKKSKKVNEVSNKESSGHSYLLQLERDNSANMLVLHILDKKTGKRTEVRGKAGYETNGYDPEDKLHQLLDKVGRSANVSELMNGEVVTINPNHPQGASAKISTTTAFNESLDNPYPFNLIGPTDSQGFVATAQTPNGVLRMDFETTDYDNFGIDFSVGKSMGKTDAGDEFKVFATVVAMMKKWISTVGIEHVESFDFGANKGEHASDGRAKLYTRFAKQLASKLGWRLEQSTTSDRSTAFFKLTNPKPVPREQEYWDKMEETVNENVSALQAELEQKYNLKSLFLADMGKRNAIELHSIIVNKEEQGEGTGSKVMQEIIAYADDNGKIVVLDPGLLDKQHGTTSQSRLRKFYKRFGFIDNKGRNKNYEFRNLMIRYPQTSESVVEAEDTLKLPDIAVGDEVMVGKFKNRKAEVKGFSKDAHNQPVLKTTKGDQKLFKPRLSKLTSMNEENGKEMLQIFRGMHHDAGMNKNMDRYIQSHDWKLGDFTPDMFPSEEEFFDYDDPFDRIIDIDYSHRVNLSQPIIVGPQFSDGKYSVIDGNHRAASAQKMGKTIRAYFPVSTTAHNESAGGGRVVKGVNTTVDVGPNEIINQVKKFGNDVDRDGKPKNNYK